MQKITKSFSSIFRSNKAKHEPGRIDRSERKILPLLSGLLAISCLVAVLWLCEPALVRELRIFHLLPESEHFTELYLESEELPRVAQKGRTISFSFVIGNSEGEAKKYPYIVYIKNREEKIIIDEGSINIEDNEHHRIQVLYTFQQDYENSTLFIELPNQKQGLHFSINSNR